MDYVTFKRSTFLCEQDGKAKVITALGEVYNIKLKEGMTSASDYPMLEKGDEIELPPTVMVKVRPSRWQRSGNRAGTASGAVPDYEVSSQDRAAREIEAQVTAALRRKTRALERKLQATASAVQIAHNARQEAEEAAQVVDPAEGLENPPAALKSGDAPKKKAPVDEPESEGSADVD